MFTGIVEEVGKLANIINANGLKQLTIHCDKLQDDLALGDSVCCNGICLTVTKFDNSQITVAAMPETVKKTTISNWRNGSRINLERALTLKTRLGGHIVQGHVDIITTVKKAGITGGAIRLALNLPKEGTHLVVDQGSVAIDGVSLTISDLTETFFTVSLVEYTLQNTNLASLSTGSKVNLEYDIIGKYVSRLNDRGNNRLTEKRLYELGF